MKPDLASYALGVMQSRCSVNLVCTDYDVINASGIVIHQNKISKTYAFTHDHVYGRYEFILNFSKGINFICCPTVMLRVSAVRNNDLWFHSDIGIGMDTYFWMEFNAVKGEFYYINKPLLEYRLHNDQITSYELGECTYKLAKPVYELIKRHNLPNDKEWICRSKNAVKKNILKKIREDEIDRASLEHLLGEFNFLPENIIRKIRVFLKVKGLYRWCYGIKQFIRDKFHGKLI
jgi:hypothetical protein